MTTLNNKPIDIDIASITGLETYKGLYYFYPNLYSYIPHASLLCISCCLSLFPHP